MRASYVKKALAVLMSLTILLSCMVWSGVGAAAKTYTCDFTGYAVVSNSDVDKSGNSKAELINTGDTAHGQAMKLYYEANATTGKAGFRFFGGTNTKVQYNAGTTPTWTKVTFDYQVQKTSGNVSINVMCGSINWNGDAFNSKGAVGCDYHKEVVKPAATATPGSWQTASVVLKSDSGQNAAVHIYLSAVNAKQEAGTAVYIDNVTVVMNYDPSSEPDPDAPVTYNFPIDDLSKSNLIGNGSGKVVKTGAEYDHNGSSTGKGMYMKMNQPYNGGGGYNAARFWLENANGYMKGKVGYKYEITAWVKSMINTTDTFYWAIGSASAAVNTNTTLQKYDETSFSANAVLLTPGVWTKVTATIDSLVGAGGTDNYLTFSAGFNKGTNTYDNQYVYVDDITIKEIKPTVALEVPPAAAVVPDGTLLGVQDFEKGAISNYTVDKKAGMREPVIGSMFNYTAGGSKSLDVVLKTKTSNNGNASRPRFAVKLGDATNASNYKVAAGDSYNLSFWVRTTVAMNTFGFYVSTMTEPDRALDQGAAALGDPYRTIQVGTANIGTPAESRGGTEFKNISLAANQWTQIIVNIPSIKAHGTDANADQYLVIHYTDNDCHDANATYATRTISMDDVSLYLVDTQWKVKFEVGEGDPVADVLGEKNGTVTLPVPYRIGYTYTGWYKDAAYTQAVTSPYTMTAKETTLYTDWKKSEPEQVSLVQDFESVADASGFSQNNAKPFALFDDNGNKVLKASYTWGYNGNFARPIWALQMNGQDTPQQVLNGVPATVSFKLKADHNTSSFTFHVDTVNDLSELSKNPPSSSASNGYRTMQVFKKVTIDGVEHTKLSSDRKEANNVKLVANQWHTITVEINAIVPHETGAQYLVLSLGDQAASSYNGVNNANYTPYDLCLDDVTLDTLLGGHTTNVIYNTMGGDKKDNGTGIIWADVTATATRKGYAFDGWFTDESCTIPVTTFPPQETITLYAGWRAASATVMDMETPAASTNKVYADVDLEDAGVTNYYSGMTNMYKGGEAYHSIVSYPGVGNVFKTEYAAAANSTEYPYGFRLVGTDTATTGFTLEKGVTYAVTFKYKVEAMAGPTSIRVLEGSINWQGPGFNNRIDHDCVDIPASAVGGDWQEGVIAFEAVEGGTYGGVHLVVDAYDYANRAGTLIYFDEVKVVSYAFNKFKFDGDVSKVDNEKNHTEGGNAAAKFDIGGSKDGYFIYANKAGNKKFLTQNINTATAWVYSDTDTTVALNAYNVHNVDAAPDRSVGTSGMVAIKGGQWNRVQFDFALPSFNGEDSAYIAIKATAASDTVLYVDDISVGTYKSDPTVTQTYEDVKEGDHSNASYFDGEIHGLNGNTVVSGKGYDGSNQSLKITMKSDTELDASRTVLFFDKKDATAAVSGSYIVTFYAMIEEDAELTFGLGTTGTIDLSNRADYATLSEVEATTTVDMTAGKWVGVSVYVSDLQGKNPEMTPNPYLTLGAWFEGAADDNVKSVYIDNVTLRSYIAGEAAKEDVLCFENTEAFGFGKQLNLNTNGTMEVVLEQNNTVGGNYSLKVSASGFEAIAGATRPQFNIVNANNDAVRVKKGANYRVTFWANIGAESEISTLRYWLAITEKEDTYTSATNQQRKDEQVYETSNWSGTVGEWKQITVEITDAPRDGYLRLGICGTTEVKSVFYLDDIRVFEFKEYELTGDEKVWDFEKYNIEDNDFIRYAGGAVSDEMNHTEGGEKSLRLVGKSNAGFGRNQYFLINPATKQPYEFTKGETYTLKFWVYCGEEYTDNFRFNMWIWGTDNLNEKFTTGSHKNDKNGTFEYDGDVAPRNEDQMWTPGTWNAYELNFTATNGKYMLVGTTDVSRTDGGYVYYIDDIQISVPERAVVTYDANGGLFENVTVNDLGQYVENTFVGSMAEGPMVDPFRQNKMFKGWALDKEGKQFFDIKTNPIPSAEFTLYAVWGAWEQDGFDKIEITKPNGDDEIKYKTEIHYEKVWTGNAQIPVLESGDRPDLEDADPVTYVPNDNTANVSTDGLPVWLIIVIVVAAVIVVGGGAFLALLLLKNKKSNTEKEVNA